MRRALAFSFPMVAVVACSSSPTEQKPSRIHSVHNPIIKGTPDTTHTGVAALQSKIVGGQYSSCSGTIIKVSGTTGYYLTAAHCVNDAQFPPELVLLGNNYDAPSKSFKVTSFLAHPQYNGQDHDFGMVTFTGADASTPTYPILTADIDTLAVGSQVEFVGYGITETNMNNATRYHVVGQLDQLSAQTFHYGQANGGPCEGDSGGPAFFTVGGIQYVAGTTSYGDQACQQYGVSSRVSAVQAWIEQYIGGTTQGAGGGTSTGGGGTSSAGGSSGVGAGGSSAGGLCASKGTWGCDPVSATTLCGGAGSACDLDSSATFMCFQPPNDAAIGAPCDGMSGPFCAQGGTCVNKACAKYCCADGDCSAGTTCQAYPGGASDVGVCAPGVSTMGAGGGATVGAGGGSPVGVGGGATFGAGGTSSTTGAGGAKTVGGGGTTSAGGATGGPTGAGAGGPTGAGAGGPTGAGGAGTSAGGSKASAGSTGTTTGAGGADSARSDGPASGSSGGCAVGAQPSGTSYGALFGLAALLVARRRRSAR